VTVVNWGDQNLRFHTQTAYEKAVARAIRSWIGLTGGHAILFPQVCGPLAADDDRIPAARVAGLLDDLASHVHHVHTAEPPDVLRAAYGRMDLFLATRLHSAIFTMTMGVPVAAIAYQDKTYGALRLLGLERWAIPIEQAGDDSVESLLLDAWESRRVIQSTIATGLPALRANSQLAANLIRRDFELLNPDLRP
jgi:colanic acid/amylovoran biosynthesis protein